MNTYKLKTEAGVTWVTIEPLQQDIIQHIQRVMEIPTETMSPEESNHVGLKMLGLKSIYDFMDALLVEHKMDQVSQLLASAEELKCSN